MIDSCPFLVLTQSCDSAVNWAVRQITESGLEVKLTFDLNTARYDQASCPCLHHGTEACDCQMVILLVYGPDCEPVSLIAHGFNGKTRFSVVDTPLQRANPGLDATIRSALRPQFLASTV